MGSSPTRGSSFEVTALGVLCCFALFVCLTLLASFFLPSHLSFTCTCIIQVGDKYIYTLRFTYMYIIGASVSEPLLC